MVNKKIKGATHEMCNSIEFKSKIEASVYNHLLQAGFNPVYEGLTFKLWEGFKPTIPYYTLKGKNNILNNSRLRDITYTPDFTFIYNGKLIIIEVKGYTNDVFPYKFKMFRKLLEEKPYVNNTILFEIFSIRQLKECIKIIKSYDSNRKNTESDFITTKE